MSNKSINEQGLSPLDRGRALYQRKDYSGALEAFTEAVRESTEFLLLNALDHRAAALEKLERLQPALKDSKRMIDLKPELSKGYLRCGKILQLKGENELALKIYERGLSKVKIGADDQRVLLQKMFRKLQESQGLGKTYDPLQFLPLELAQMICSQLNMRDRVVCLAVSPPWKKVLESMHELWTTLDTSLTRKSIKKSSLKAHIKRSNYTINHAIISTRAYFDSEQMRYLTRTCQKLKTLEIHGSGTIGSSLVEALSDAHNLRVLTISKNCEITLSHVRQALDIRKRSIVEASFENVTGHGISNFFKFSQTLDALRSIELRSKSDAAFDIETFIKLIPNVDRVTLTGWARSNNTPIDATPWKRLEYLDLSRCSLVELPNLPPTLKHLILDENHHINKIIYEDFCFELPLLETISVRECLNLSTSALFSLSSESIKHKNLKNLDVSGRFHDSHLAIATQYPLCESLESLGFGGMIVNDKDITRISDQYPNLKKLDIKGTKVTGVGVKHVVGNGVKLLDLSQCDALGEDAVKWAKNQGVEVVWKSGSQGSKRTKGSFWDANGAYY